MLNFFNKKPANFISAIVPAAGQSTRMGDIDKMFYEIDDTPVIALTIRALESSSQISEIILVVPERLIPDYMQMVSDFRFRKVSVITKGGATRQESVASGISHVNEKCEYICIHDGARPFVTDDIIDDCIRGALACGAASAAIKTKDTVKEVDENGFVVYTPPRDYLYLTQTPQVFELSLYKEALAAAKEDYTDDCQLIEAIDHKVLLTTGSSLNLKLTTPEDLLIAESIYDSLEI